tara:strand:- start:2137 stop:2487 length:351 start_codon:yes stop_codon:yes gene_type:complete
MKTLSIEGLLVQKNDVENIQNKEGKQWVKQTFLIDTGAEYNSRICFQLFGEEKTKLIENHQIGDKIEVFFNISSREYNSRYYHNIDAWKINTVDPNKAKETEDNTPNEATEDSLPF